MMYFVFRQQGIPAIPIGVDIGIEVAFACVVNYIGKIIVRQVSAFLQESAVSRTDEFDLVSSLEQVARSLQDYRGTRTIYIAGCISFATGIRGYPDH